MIYPTFQNEPCCGTPASIIRGLGFSSQRATGARHGGSGEEATLDLLGNVQTTVVVPCD